MLVLINPNAGGANALKKWGKLDDGLLDLSNGVRAFTMQDPSSFAFAIQRSFSLGERDFVAAGGDGTVNLVLDALVNLRKQNRRNGVRLGAIGLGSSNDFHKPIHRNQLSNGIPIKLDFGNARPRDIGRVRYDDNGRMIERFFISNASIGVTAEANHFFNNPGPLLRVLKRIHTPGAILYAALNTILAYVNLPINFRKLERDEFTSPVTNLGILKNPHVSGDFCYQSSIPVDDGKFVVHLCHSMTTIELLRLLWALGRGQFESVQKRRSWSVTGFSVHTSTPFAVEFDGEVIRSSNVEFSVLPRFLKVCP